MSAAVDMNTSSSDIKLKRYIRNITRHMKQIFGTANKIQCDDEKTDAHAAEIENWNVDYDMN